MGRPPTKAVTLRDGFYIQFRNKGANWVGKIRSNDSESMMSIAKEYEKYKEVVILGELKNGVWMNEAAAKDKVKAEAKAQKAKAKALPKPKAKPVPKPKSKSKTKPKTKSKSK